MVPTYVPVSTVARALTMAIKPARRVLEHEGCVVRLGPGRYRFVDTEGLARQLPEAYRALVRYLEQVAGE